MVIKNAEESLLGNLRPPACTPPPFKVSVRGEEQLQADPGVSRKIHTRVLGPGALNRHDGHFQRVLQQYCVHKQKRVCSILPLPKRGACAWRKSLGTFEA